MNYPVWFLPEIGGGMLMAIIAITHVFVSHIAVGGGLYLVLTEMKARRENDFQMLEFVKKHSKFFMLVSMVYGGVTGVGIWFTIGLIQPDATSELIHTFVFGWAAEWVWFLVEIVALLVYYYKFNTMDERNHVRVGWVYFAAAWLSLFLINGIIDFMLTPGEWVNNHNFWSGFFNPTFWPSLWFRFAISTLLAGVFAFFSTVFIDSETFRHKMTRYSSLWCLISTAVVIPTGYWYLKALPPMAQEIVSVSPTIANSIKVGVFSTAAFIILVTICTFWKPKLHTLLTAFVVSLCAISMMGSFEWIREAGRRPYIISQLRYSNGIPVSRVAELNKGFLAQSKWSTISEVDESNLEQAGAELFKFQCYACHTLDGVNNDIRVRTANSSFNGMVKYLGVMHEKRPFMPPFIGSDIEKRALAAYLVGTLHGKEVTAAATTGGNIGQQILDDDCTMCHGADLVVDWADGMSVEEVTQGLLTLSEIDNSMEDFSGSAEQLNALVALLTGTAMATDVPAFDGAGFLNDDCTMCHGLDLVYEWAADLSLEQVEEGLRHLSAINSSMDDFSGTEAELTAVSTFIVTESKGGTQ